MRKKRVYDLTEIDGLKKEDFPVVDILRKGSERIGCASVALLNAIELLNHREDSENRSELLLHFEYELQAQDGAVTVQNLLPFVDSFAESRNLECMSCFEVKPNLEALLFLLVNGFCFLIYNDSTTSTTGHLDIIWHDKRTKQIYFNAWVMNQDDFEGLVYHKQSFLIGLRSLKQGRFLYFQKHLRDLTVALTDEQKMFLQKSEILLLEKTFTDDIHSHPDFKNLSIEEVLKNKVELLGSIGTFPENYLVLLDR